MRGGSNSDDSGLGQAEWASDGEALRPIVMALGKWGAHRIGSRLKRGQLDAGSLMWDIRRVVHFDEFPHDPRCSSSSALPTRTPANAAGGWSSKVEMPTCATTTQGPNPPW